MEYPMTPPQSSSSNRTFLEASPTFSDYYTESSPSADCGSAVIQRQLLHRLDSFRDQIANVEPDSNSAKLLDAQLDGLEAALNAPETQTREPTDLEDSGLFLSEEEEQELQARVESAKLLAIRGTGKQAWEQVALFKVRKDRELQELRETVERYEALCFEFKKRFQEVKHINELVELKLLSGNAEVSRLYTSNKSLTAENQSLREDLQLTGSEIVFLKLQLNAIEQEASSHLPQDGLDLAFERALDQWKLDWNDINNRYSRRTAPPKGRQSSSHPNVMGHTKTLSEPNLVRPNPDWSATLPLMRSDIHTVASSAPSLPIQCFRQKKSSQTSPEKVSPPRMPRWQAFWDALADAAGIIDYDELF